MHKPIFELAVRYPKLVFAAMATLVIVLGAQIPNIVIDTDPENMLSEEQAERVYHNEVKEKFSLHDSIVVGVVNEEDPDGVFNPDSLGHIHTLTREIEQIEGVISQDVLSPASVDNIIPEDTGVVRFEWLMNQPPETRDEARAIRQSAQRIPMLDGTILSEDGEAVAIVVPIEEKDMSHRIAGEIEEIVAGFQGTDRVFITGLPVAEDTFGVEMFYQMGVTAPLAGLLVLLLMWWFFRSFALVISPMILAIVTVVATMGLLIWMGYPVHIMSSMIPIFLMPIAVVDSVHILSEFADLYPSIRDPNKTMAIVIDDLFTPMLYTSLTSAAGFASLALTPIPPVQVFGIFVAIGILLAFVLSILFLPAYVVSLNPERLAKLANCATDTGEGKGLLANLMRMAGRRVGGYAKLIIAAVALILGVSVWGITQIQVNDNPVRWFEDEHSIRVADRVLNEHFAGTYNAFLVLEKTDAASLEKEFEAEADQLLANHDQRAPQLRDDWAEMQADLPEEPFSVRLDEMVAAIDVHLDEAGAQEEEFWFELMELVQQTQTATKYFQSPEALGYIEELQRELEGSPFVGKTQSTADVVKTVMRDLRGGDEEHFALPDSSRGVAATFLTYQSSHRPDDLWHMITPDYRSANIWVNLNSGDNQDMLQVVERAERFMEANPPPPGVETNWAGLTYINVVWQQEMVGGMLYSLLGSFVIVFIMMILLFRSVKFGVLAMLPLTVTIVVTYGFIGLIGKDYDMPVAVLSSLALGLSIDFAIHFLERGRAIFRETGSWSKTVRALFEEPARALSRNAIVIAFGFVPLLASPLIPYNTVGFLLAAIMALSCVVTLSLLPAILGLNPRWFFKTKPGHEPEVHEGLRSMVHHDLDDDC